MKKLKKSTGKTKQKWHLRSKIVILIYVKILIFFINGCSYIPSHDKRNNAHTIANTQQEKDTVNQSNKYRWLCEKKRNQATIGLSNYYISDVGDSITLILLESHEISNKKFNHIIIKNKKDTLFNSIIHLSFSELCFALKCNDKFSYYCNGDTALTDCIDIISQYSINKSMLDQISCQACYYSFTNNVQKSQVQGFYVNENGTPIGISIAFKDQIFLKTYKLQ